MDDVEQLAGLGRTLHQLLLTSYGLHPDDLADEVRSACRHLGGDAVDVLLADLDQRVLVPFDRADLRRLPIDGSDAGRAFREETAVESAADDGRRRLWLPIKDSAERVGVLAIVDGGTVPATLWEAVASLLGELVVSKSNYGDHISMRRRTTAFSLAAEMRWGMFPPLTFTSPEVTIAAFVQPPSRIAGDAFDYSVDGRTVSLAIFDAMGHGLEASRMANVAVGCYRTMRRSGADLVATLVAIDDVISTQFGDLRYVTAQLATFDLDSGVLAMVNAGHPPPLWVRSGRPPSELDCPVTVPTGLGSSPVVSTTTLAHGDSILFRTDGIVDARSPDGEFFGDRRLAALVETHTAAGTRPAEVLRQCLHTIVEHQGERPNDDATILMLRWAGSAQPASSG